MDQETGKGDRGKMRVSKEIKKKNIVFSGTEYERQDGSDTSIVLLSLEQFFILATEVKPAFIENTQGSQSRN